MEEENNNNNKNKEILKKIIMAVLRHFFKPILIIAIIAAIIICIIAAAAWFLKRFDAIENANDIKNAPAAVRNFMNNTNVDANGLVTSAISIKDFWEELIKNGNRATSYLNSEKELAKLVHAAQALDFPDTRKNPDTPINWNDLDLEANEIQGIVKFKRALADGNNITMTYVTPSKLQELMNKYMETGKEKDKQEALKHFTLEKTYSASGGTTTGGNPLLQEALTYACSWVGKIPYKSKASGDGNNNERFLPLKAGRASDCSHFIHWVFEHVGLMHKDKFVRSLMWGRGGDNGGCPGTVRIGTDLSNASPGDVLWWHYGDEWRNHVAIYLGNNKTVECCAGEGTKIGKIKNLKDRGANCQILHFKQFPTDPTGYFDPETMTLHSSLINSNTSGDIAKVGSLNGMVFLGDSILTSIVNHSSILKNEGVTSMHQPGCRPRFFLGEETVGGRRFNWNKEFSRISNPTGFYLLLGQNSCHDKDNRIKEMDRLIQKIKSSYPSAPIYMSSVLYHLDKTGADKRAATAMNEELKVYCASQSNVYYSDILRGYNDNLKEMSYDNDHPNKKGSEVLINNIKQNIIGYSSVNTASSSTASTSTSTATYNTRVPASGKYDVTNCFSPETQRIVDAHRNDFNINNFKQKMQQAGGYESYVRSLGGVFTKYIDKKGYKVQNAGEFQEICEYTFGLMTIWGFDYGNGVVHRSWGGRATPAIKAGAFYPHGTDNSYREYQHINDACSNVNNPSMKTNCNTGVNMLLETAGLAKNSQHLADGKRSGSKKVIYNKSELQVGDIMNFYRDSGRTSWHHAAIVGEVDKERNLLTIYDFAGRFLESGGRYKLTCPIDDSKDLGNGYSHYWCGVRWFDLDQSVGVANNTTSSSSASDTTRYQVKVATWNEYTDGVTSNDPDVQSYGPSTTYTMTTTDIPYQQIVSKFKMPFNYIWAMLIYGQEKNFVFDLAELVKNSKIEITIHDNLNETTNVITDTYTDYTRIHAEADVRVGFDRINYVTESNTDPITNITTNTRRRETTGDSSTKHAKADGDDTKNYKVVQTTITKNNMLDIALTLANAWYTTYEKIYTYNKPETSHNNSSTKLDDIVNDPYTKNGQLGGLDDKIDSDAIRQVRESESSIENLHVIGRSNEKARFQTSRIKRNNNVDTKIKSSSYTPSPGKNVEKTYISIGETPKTGQLNNSNFINLPHKSLNNIQEGFCFIGDDLYAVSMWNNNGSNKCKVYLLDMATFTVCDYVSNLYGHGNSLTYDSVTGDIIFSGKNSTTLIHVNTSTKKLENPRNVSTPATNTALVAYNKQYDLFISFNGKGVYTRQEFYGSGKRKNQFYSKKPYGNLVMQAGGTYGNHVYICYSSPNPSRGNYILVCNIHTGKQEKVIYDNTPREIEELDFTSDGTMYIIYGGGGKNFYKTDYNYFADNDIDKSNVTPGMVSNAISRYNTGGEYIDKSSFVSLFNAHVVARSNILNAKEWLFDALQQNSDTKRMVDLTKYLFYKATGVDYGVTTFDFEAYQLEDFNEIGAGTLEGNNTEERVWLALINAGFNDVAAAAAMGNLSYESGGSDTKTIKTDTVEGGYTEDNGGIGMCQWTNNARGTEGRNAQLKKYAQSKGTTWKDEKTQIEFLVTEITGEGSAKGYANIQFMTKTYDGVTYPKDALKTVENNQSRIEYATKAFAATFERPAASAFTSSMSKRVELAKYFYSQYNGKRSATIGNGDILKACEDVIKIYLSRNTEYSIDGNKLIYGNIEKCLNEAKYGCCATFTSSALYKSGVLTADQINKYNYHYTGEGGIPDMLKAAGWKQVQMSEAKAGDVVVDYGNHVLIYAGGDNFYDNRCCIHGANNRYAATQKVRSGFSSYRNRGGVQVWRAPGK